MTKRDIIIALRNQIRITHKLSELMDQQEKESDRLEKELFVTKVQRDEIKEENGRNIETIVKLRAKLTNYHDKMPGIYKGNGCLDECTIYCLNKRNLEMLQSYNIDCPFSDMPCELKKLNDFHDRF